MDQKLAALLAEVFGLRESEISPQLNKEDIDSWDSLKQMDLVVSLEREYNLALDMPDIVEMTGVESIISVLQRKGVDLES
jgi:acyl carrier protein